ncbi:MAG: hypothetical protein ACOYO1_08390 [Bacteroidales bacterium]
MNWHLFKLEKLYLDCIDKDGNCFIVYWANLDFYFINLKYSGSIFSDSLNKSIENSSLKRIQKPIINNLIHFNNASLHLNANWERKEKAVSLLLYKDEKGKYVNWNCHHPKTMTNIIYNGNTFQGWGYAETLTMNIKPWQLPIDELRWGRYLSENNTIIWIHWKGNYPVNKVFYNGILFEDAVFDEKSICFDQRRTLVEFQNKTIIRKGKIANVLARMPWLKLIFNRKILNTIEIKYKAKSSLSINTKVIDNGWSLFEIVEW